MLSQQVTMATVEEPLSNSFVAKLFPRRTPSKPWPSPKDSIGQKRGIIKGQQFWDVTGPALEQARKIKPAVSALLATYNECDYFQGYPATSAILFDVFMVMKVGLTEDTACPALVIICQRPEIPKQIGKRIRESKLLENYPGFKFLGSTRDPRFPSGPGPQFIAYGDEFGQNLVPGVGVYASRQQSSLQSGCTIYVRQKESDTFREATLGGFLSLSESEPMVVGMTAAHVFDDFQDIDSRSEVSDELIDLMEDSDASDESIDPMEDSDDESTDCRMYRVSRS